MSRCARCKRVSEQDIRRFSVGAFGMLTWDQLLQLDSLPRAGTYQIVKRSLEQSGGTTGNMVVAIARLGVDVSIASCVGDDDVGRKIIDDLQVEGCDATHVSTLQETPTDRGVILVTGDQRNPDRTILWIQGARLKHGFHLPIEEFFAKDLVLVDVDDPRLRLFLLDLPMHVSPRTRIFGTMTFLAELESAHALELALRHDYLVGNVSELKHTTECDDLADAFSRFQSEMILSQVRFAAFSDGANGCYMVTRDDVIHVQAFAIDAIDPTGAGDAFAAGVAYGTLHRWDLTKTGRFANAMGALATRKLGARSAIPTLEETRDLLNAGGPRNHHGDHEKNH
jgi:sugar/nucleoside kinase (ribokinase family)